LDELQYSNIDLLLLLLLLALHARDGGDAAMWSSSIRMSLTFKNDFGAQKISKSCLPTPLKSAR
jgi:hypothetical protein